MSWVRKKAGSKRTVKAQGSCKLRVEFKKAGRTSLGLKKNPTLSDWLCQKKKKKKKKTVIGKPKCGIWEEDVTRIKMLRRNNTSDLSQNLRNDGVWGSA